MLLDNVRLAVGAFVFLIFIWALNEASGFSGMGRWFPYMVATGGVIMSGANVVFEIWRNVRARRKLALVRQQGEAVDESGVGPDLPKFDTTGAESAEEFVSAAKWFGVLLAYPATMYFVGALVGSVIWVGVFIRFITKKSLTFTAVYVGLIMALLFGYSRLFNLRLPRGILW